MYVTRVDDDTSSLWTGCQVLFQKKLVAPHVVSRAQLVNTVFRAGLGEWLEQCGTRARLIVLFDESPVNELNVEWHRVTEDLYTASVEVSLERLSFSGLAAPDGLVLVDAMQQLVDQWALGMGLKDHPPRIQLTRRELAWLESVDAPPRVNLALTMSGLPEVRSLAEVGIWEYFPGGVEAPVEYFRSRFADAGRPGDILQELRRMIGIWVDRLGCRADSIEMQAVDLICQGRTVWERALNAPEQFENVVSESIDDAEDILVMIYDWPQSMRGARRAPGYSSEGRCVDEFYGK